MTHRAPRRRVVARAAAVPADPLLHAAGMDATHGAAAPRPVEQTGLLQDPPMNHWSRWCDRFGVFCSGPTVFCITV